MVVRWSDVDAFGHVNNVAVLRLLEEARITAFAALADAVARQAEEPGEQRGGGAPRVTLLETGVVVARHEIEYLRPLLWRPAPVPVRLWVTGLGGASFDLGYAVGGADVPEVDQGGGDPGGSAGDDAGPGVAGGRVTAWAASTMVALDAGSGAPRRLSAGERSVLGSWLEEAVPFRRSGWAR